MKFAVFFNKGHGKKLMHSSFLVQHPTEPLFRLSESEWEETTKKYPELEDDCNLEYHPRSADAFIEPGKDNYFDNSTILSQFERLFKMTQFKKSFLNHQIEVIVDNARTHTAVNYDVNSFSLKPGTKCPYESIDWIENEIEHSIDCYDEDGRSKGLINLAAELGFKFDNNKKYNLKDYRDIVSTHIAFKNKTKLEVLAEKYNIRIIFCPKFHCELNPIEGLWCFMKNYIRKNTDQSFVKMRNLSDESLIIFQQSDYNFKLWRRFWRLLALYKDGKSYEEVLQTLFSHKSEARAIYHLKVSNTLLDLS